MTTGLPLPFRVALLAGIAAALPASCGGPPPSHLAGASAHFRLFVGDGYDLQATLATTADDVLTGLETNWSDTATMLAMPDGQIDYYLLSDGQVGAVCVPEASGCQQGRSVYTSLPADQHELNHAYLALLTSHQPAAFLVEGIAEAIGCGYGAEPPRAFNNVLDWRSVVNYASYGDVYSPGRELVRYLILNYGVERLLAYYAQAPDTRDPDLFASNFVASWSVDLDTVWSTMQTAQPAWGPTDVLPICPCSLTAWSAAAGPTAIARAPAHPYWTWPALAGDTAVWAGNLGAVAIADCNRQDLAPFTSFGVMFARLDGPLFATVSAATVARGPYLSDACSAAQVYSLPTALLSSTGGAPVWIAVPAPSGTSSSVYMALEAAAPLAIASDAGFGPVSVCPTCDAAGTGCQTLPSRPDSLPVTGSFYLRWDAPATQSPYASRSLWFSPG